MHVLRSLGIINCLWGSVYALETELYYLQENLKELIGLVKPNVETTKLSQGMTLKGNVLTINMGEVWESSPSLTHYITIVQEAAGNLGLMPAASSQEIITLTLNENLLDTIKKDIRIVLKKASGSREQAILNICGLVFYLQQVMPDKLGSLLVAKAGGYYSTIFNSSEHSLNRWNKFVQAVIDKPKQGA